MNTTQFHSNKLDLIEKIIDSNDNEIIDFMNNILEEKHQFSLSEIQKYAVVKSTENYLSGKDKGKSWIELKESLLISRNG